MDAYQFLSQYGWTEAEQVAISAGTNKSYFSQLAHGHRRPSVDLAQRLVAASNGRLDLTQLLTSTRTTIARQKAAKN